MSDTTDRTTQEFVPNMGSYGETWLLSEAARQYEGASPWPELAEGRKALLVVDMIDAFVRPNWSPLWCPSATEQVPRVAGVLQAFRRAKAPVIFTTYGRPGQVTADRPASFHRLPMSRALRGHSAAALYPDEGFYGPLKPLPGEHVVYKSSYSSFAGTTLQATLENLAVNVLVICGTMTNYCCGMAAREAFLLGYHVVFGSDINACDDPAIQSSELKTLARGFACVLPAKGIVGLL
jgi:nicotinamidase-related amidase